jgi:radical SAM protein with 4Fe4S-binding SPASM domain
MYLTKRLIEHHLPDGSCLMLNSPAGEKRCLDRVRQLAARQATRLWKKRNVFEMTQCQECSYALICGGGCAFDRGEVG